jgi:hypothetical protein
MINRGSVCRKALFSMLCVFLPVLPAFAQDEDLWICPGAELAMYSSSGAAYGGAAALGYGKGLAIGLKAAWFVDDKEVSTFELSFLLRLYLFGGSYSGPFIQFNGGPALFFYGADVVVPSEMGTICAGLGLGWRFLAGDRWFFEPAIRAGFPYVVGLGLSAGMRF